MGQTYGRRRKQPQPGPGAWPLLLLVGALALLLRFGTGEPIAAARAKLAEAWQGSRVEEAVETLGRSFFGEEEGGVAVFGKKLLGLGEE